MGRKESNQTNKQQRKYKLTSEHEQEMIQSQIVDQSIRYRNTDRQEHT